MSTVQGGPKYIPVTIGTQTWMRINLDVSTYQNGDPIPQVTGSGDWTYYGDNQIGAWCYYDFNSNYNSLYGKLYNWWAVSDPRSLAPVGWNVATSTDYQNLSTYLGGIEVAGGAMKDVNNWSGPNTGATNSSGFTARAGGLIDSSGVSYEKEYNALFWCSDEGIANEPYYITLNYLETTINIGSGNFPSYGFSVRCILI
jgi:uncharacterized protein (TIGR02145 family)